MVTVLDTIVATLQADATLLALRPGLIITTERPQYDVTPDLFTERGGYARLKPLISVYSEDGVPITGIPGGGTYPVACACYVPETRTELAVELAQRVIAVLDRSYRARYWMTWIGGGQRVFQDTAYSPNEYYTRPRFRALDNWRQE